MAIKKNLLTEKWLKTIKTMSDEQKGLADKRIWAYILIGILLFLSTFFINGNGCRAPSNKTRIETFLMLYLHVVLF